MKKLISTLFLFFIVSKVFGQYTLPEKRSFEKMEIVLNDYSQIFGKNVIIIGDSIRYEKSVSSFLTTETRHLNSILFLKVVEGNNFGKGTGLGALTMGVSGLLAIFEVQADERQVLKQNWVSIYALYILGGAFVGGVIGSAIEKETIYYVNKK